MNCVLVLFLTTSLLCASSLELKESPEKDVDRITEGTEIEEEGATNQPDLESGSPCIYKGKFFTINVKKIVNRLM